MKPLFINFLRKSTIHLLFAMVFFVSSQTIKAQDFHLSQYDAAPLFLNPSMTGMFDGAYRMHFHYRTQWAAVTTKPFNTAGISFDMPLKKFGIGLQIMNYRAGTGNYNVFNALLSLGYDVVFDKAQNHHLALGAQGGITQKSISMNKLTFASQYTNADGGSFDMSLSSGEVLSNVNFIVPEMNAGFLYYYAKESSRLNPFIGLSAFNLTQPKETFFGSDNTVPIRYYIHGGTKINVSTKVQLLPKFIYMSQLNNQEFTATLLMHYYMKDADTYLIFGPTYRNKDAAIIELGLRKGRYTARVSYDVNTSSLKRTSGYRGGFEISLTYIARKSKPNPLANCPRL